jgi:ribosomal protein L40E
MARKSLGYVELEWSCPNCGTRNPGTQETCGGCGSPQPDDVKFEQVQSEELISDEVKIKKAKKGPDIHCPYCGARNPGDAEICNQCGGDLVEGLRRESGQVIGAFSTDEAPPISVVCPNCGTENQGKASNCLACGASLKKKSPGEPEATAAGKKAPEKSVRKRGCGILVLALLGLGFLGVILFLVLGLGRKEDVNGTVQSVQWVRAVAIEVLADVTRSDFLESIPIDAEPFNCRQEYHHTQIDPVPGADEVCGTPYTVDSGTGLGEVVQDCEYRVDEDYCDYVVQEWQQIDELRLEGTDQNPQWPASNLEPDQREGAIQEFYTIRFEAGGDIYDYQTSDEQIFRQCKIGSRWVLSINTFGNVVDIN